MATHPAEPDTGPSETEPAAPNPSRLPVEPEFGQTPTPLEPEDPGVSKPSI